MPTLYIAKGFDYAISHRFYRQDWSENSNLAFFGKESLGKFGHGHTHHAYFVFSGPIQSNGMICELSRLKTEINSKILSQIDHHFLNECVFLDAQPSASEVAKHLLTQSKTLFKSWPVTVEMIQLYEDPDNYVFVNSTQSYEDIALQLYNVHLLDTINTYATCHLRVRFYTENDPNLDLFQEKQKIKLALQTWARKKSDHFLATPFQPRTLETHVQDWWVELSSFSPHFLSAIWDSHRAIQTRDQLFSGFKGHFLGSHSLEDLTLTVEQNKSEFGKCSYHHGHTFYYDTLFSSPSLSWKEIFELQSETTQFFDKFSYRSFSHEDPRIKLATCEHLVTEMYQNLCKRISGIHTIQLDETPRNRIIITQRLLL